MAIIIIDHKVRHDGRGGQAGRMQDISRVVTSGSNNKKRMVMVVIGISGRGCN